LGLRFVKGLRREVVEVIECEQAIPFRHADDLAQRCALREEELAVLAEIGALASLGLSRRQALWQVARAAKPAGPLFNTHVRVAADNPRAGRRDEVPASPLPEMSAVEHTLADFAGSGMTVGPQALEHVRRELTRRGILTASDLARQRNGKRVKTAGSVIVRQRPGTAKGLLFLTLEDETGMSQAIVAPHLLQQHRQLIVGSPHLVVEGRIQKKDGTVSLKAERFWALRNLSAAPSHDFR